MERVISYYWMINKRTSTRLSVNVDQVGMDNQVQPWNFDVGSFGSS